MRDLCNLIERDVIHAEPWGGGLQMSLIFTGIEQMPDFAKGLHASGRIVRRSTQVAPGCLTASRTFEEVEHDANRAALSAANDSVLAAARVPGLSWANLALRKGR